ncbi:MULTISPECIES: TlpA family protein disulfide reductase [Candidatus Ichthyocystis]|uniref:Putative redoxin n=1 Tax=Candidatus Ichthyocystis hellenicum TaxID=1561003 RepID=A0A0S4M365_9BURK|nr:MULTISPECIES: TlpA disulfide reductase family protein [Ichthyocystis]CUT17314.1 putative redoxin [Candidatus Ichthyocystis hellenicum]
MLLRASIFVFLVLILGGYVCRKFFEPSANTPESSTEIFFRDINIVGMDGKPVTLRAEFGQVIFSNFWGTWCDSCERETDLILGLYRDYVPLGVKFVSVAIDSIGDVVVFNKKKMITYPVYVSDISAIRFLLKYGDMSGVLPFTLVIHSRFRQAFVGELKDKVIRKFIDNELCLVRADVGS